MMEIVAAIGGGAFVLASLVLGARLMMLSLRTRGFHEFVLGAALFGMGGVGYPLMAVAQQAKQMDHELRVALLVTQMLLTGLGMTGIGVFNWRVFRPGSLFILAITPVIALAYLACAVAQGVGPGFDAILDGEYGPWTVGTCVGIAVMVWAGAESVRYFHLLRKRMALGLADAVVADRFRLWSISMFSAALISKTGLVLQEVFGIAMSGTTAGHLVVGPLGLVVAGALWLAFLPPARYLRRVESRAAALTI
jgi:hypothetical protein